MQYQRYIYWLEENDFLSIRDNLIEKNISLLEAKKAVCIPLAKNVEVGFVPPHAWERYELCKRQMSWYQISAHAGRTLLVSSFPLDEFGILPEAIVKESKFRPPYLPDDAEKKRMRYRPGYEKVKPPQWEDIETEDPAQLDRWLKIMGVRGVTFQQVFDTHCANHANFIDPVYFITDKEEVIPYSIAKTSHICSACLEFYNIVGSEFRRKFVVPCPGAVLFAGLPVNRHMEVVTVK